MFTLTIKHRALLMTKSAYEWYENQKDGLGEEFLSALDICYKKLELTPTFYKRISNEFRQVRLKRFPYVVVYEIIKNEVIVFAVFHTSRNPNFKFKN